VTASYGNVLGNKVLKVGTGQFGPGISAVPRVGRKCRVEF
jgi:hypothetical protein